MEERKEDQDRRVETTDWVAVSVICDDVMELV